MNRSLRAILVCLIVIGTFAAMFLFPGCGGNGISLSLNAGSQSIEQGAAGTGGTSTLTAKVKGDTSGVTWGTPTCGSISPCGTLTNMTSTTATYNAPDTGTTLTTNPTVVTITAASVKQPTKTASVTIDVIPAPGIPPALSTTPATVGTAYNQSLVTGGVPPFKLKVTASGSISTAHGSLRSVTAKTSDSCTGLPTWLVFNQNTGALSGAGSGGVVPNTATDFACTLQVTDKNNVSSPPVSVTINVPVTVLAATLPSAEQSGTYSYTFTPAGGTGSYTSWSVPSGSSLPAGLTLDNTGKLSGTVTASTTSTFSVQVTDSSNAVGSQSYTITIAPQVQVAAPASAALAANIGTNYTLSLQPSTGTGVGPFTWTLSSGTLPPWLTLSSAGVLSSTGKVPTTATTTAPFTVQVKDANNITATAQINVSVPIVIAGTLQNAEQSSTYNATLTAEGGSGTGYTFSVASGSLPAGLTLAGSGAITGTITGSTSGTFTVQAKDSTNTVGSQSYTITIVPQVAIATPANLNAPIGSAYSLALQTSTGTGVAPFTWSVSAGSLPAWLTLNGSTGAITSTGSVPTTATDSTFTVKVVDANSVAATLPLNINVPIVVSGTVQNAEQSTAYSATLTAEGGSGTGYSFSVASGSLPAGLSLSTGGAITGTITGSTSGTFTVKATDSVSATGTSQSYTITIVPQVAIATPANLSAPIGGAYSLALQTSTGTGVAPFTWSISAGSLPTWLSLNPSTGAITTSANVPANAVDSSFTVKVVDANSVSATLPVSITVPLVVTGAVQSAEQSNAYTATLSAEGGSGTGYSFSLASGSLPAGLSLSTGGVISGTITGSTSGTFTVKVTDSASASGTSQSYTIAVVPAPQIATPVASALIATIGSPYSLALQTTTGTGASPFTWSISAGSLPAWLSLNPSTGAITASANIPTTAIDSTFTVKVVDANSVSATLPVSITVPLVVTGTVQSAEQSNAYTATLGAEGGTGTGYSFSIASGSLPAGLSLSTGGAITGTITGATSGTFTVKVTDSASASGTSQSYTISVVPAPQIATPVASALIATVGSPFSLALQTTTGTGASPFTWSISAGSLPAWLSLNPSTGAITASASIPTTAIDSAFTVKVVDANNVSATLPVSITVPLLITGTVQNAEQSTAYSATLGAEGGTGTYSFTVASGSLPTGLSLSSAGAITGTITGSTSGTFTVKVTDSASVSLTSPSFTINVVPAPQITTPLSSALVATIGSPYGLTLQTTPNTGVAPFAWSISAGTLPAWLSFNNGVFSVTGNVPTSAVDVGVTVKVVDANSVSATLPLTFVVPLSILTNSISAGEVGLAYSSSFTAQGGAGGYTWSATGLPAWASINAATGAITNTAAAQATPAGGTAVIVKVTDSASVSATTAALTLNVYPAVTVSAISLPGATIGTAYNQALSASNGLAPYSNWHVSSGNLPTGLSLDPTAGAISGTPACPAVNASFQVTVTDSLNVTSSPLPLSIVSTVPALAINTTSLPSAAAGVAYSQMLQATGGALACGATPTWTVTTGPLPAWLTLSSSGTLSGTPGVGDVGTPVSFTVQVSDGANTATQALSINFGAVYSVSGKVTLTGGTTPLPGVVVALGASQSATTDSNGNFTINGVANGTYTISPSYTATGVSSAFYPSGTNLTDNAGALQVIVSGGNLTGVNFTAALGYTVSGTVAYGGKHLPPSQQVFVTLQNTACSTCPLLGTSIPTPIYKYPASFTVTGVPAGSYTVTAWSDYWNFGIPDQVDASGTASLSVSANVANAAVTLKDQAGVPSFVYTKTNMQVYPMEQGAVVTYNPITLGGIEQAWGYNLNWVLVTGNGPAADTAACNGTGYDAGTGPPPDGSMWLDAGTLSGNPVPAGIRSMIILDGQNQANTVPVALGNQDGTQVLFCMEAWYVSASAEAEVGGGWTYETVTLGPPTGANTLSGNVNIPATDAEGGSVSLSGPLYAGCYDQNTGNVFADVIEFPQIGTNAYTVSGVPNNAKCSLFAVVDQNNDGLITPGNPYNYATSPGGAGNAGSGGDIYNIDWDIQPVTVTQSMSSGVDIDLTPDVENATVAVTTKHTQVSGQDKYAINFQARSLEELPISLRLLSGPSVLNTTDFGVCSISCDLSEFNASVDTNGVVPQVGDTYTLEASYSLNYLAGASVGPDMFTATVGGTGVVNAFATNLSATGGATPTFTWTYPANATNYTYQFVLLDSNGNTVWQIPGGATYGFSSSAVTSIVWPNDPTSTSNNPPTIPPVAPPPTGQTIVLPSGSYTWLINTMDSAGNYSQAQGALTVP